MPQILDSMESIVADEILRGWPWCTMHRRRCPTYRDNAGINFERLGKRAAILERPDVSVLTGAVPKEAVSISAGDPNFLAKDNSSLGKYVAAGFCLGFSLWGYFVYAFLCPGILIFVLTSRAGRKCDTWRTIWKRVYTRSRALLCQLHPSGRLAGGTNQNLALC